MIGFADGEAKETMRVDSDSMLSFEPIDFEWAGGLPTRISPFTWDACDVRVFDIPETSDWVHVRKWFDHWFDGEEIRQADEHGLYGVIHFLADPKRAGDATTLQVDFGSAPEKRLRSCWMPFVIREQQRSRLELLTPEDRFPSPIH